ncbi:hypothetical protein [Leucobacter coleopterorum]|uniref:hypothetical protein n=1 Tax=Leucobacter coleopterorum TaxID=2714933 RepID=UPI001FCA8207|nr:hypothetical protein [Leucobacter coleopterorum]
MMRRVEPPLVNERPLIDSVEPDRPVEATENADLVLRGGTVLVLDAVGSRAEAVAVSAGRIVAVGSSQDIETWIGASTRIIELGGRTLMPGVNDSHLHGSWLGARWPHTLFGAPDPEAASQIAGPLVSDRAGRRAAILGAGRLLIELGITSYTEPGIGPGRIAVRRGAFIAK